MSGIRDVLRNVPLTDVVLFTDDVHLSGTVNKQKCQYRFLQNPLKLHKRPFHSLKVNDFGVSFFAFGVWGPYFSEEDGVTANSDPLIVIVRRSKTFVGRNHFFLTSMDKTICFGFGNTMQSQTQLGGH